MTSSCTASTAPAAQAPPFVTAPPHAGMWPLITLAVGFIMAMLDVTVVNVGLSSIEQNLAAPLTTLVWIIDGYTLTFAAALLVGGALADRYGARNIYLLGLAVFVLASLLCGAAPSGGMLVAARLLQGLGAALFMPSSLSLMSHVYRDDKVRARMLGIWSAAVGGAAAVGPLVGGVLIHAFGWRSVFLINVPLGLFGLAMAYRILPAVQRQARELTAYSQVLGVAMLGALSFALIQGPAYGWTSAPILGAALATLVSGGLLVHHERRGKAPLLPRALFATPQFAAANGIGFLINFSVYGQLFFLSLFVQQARHADALQTGLQLLPTMLVIFAGNLLSGRITAHRGPRAPMLLGLGLATVFGLLQTTLAPATPYWLFALLAAATNFGASIAIPAMTVVVMQVAGRAHANSAAAALNANRQIGALVGVALIGAVLHTFPDWGLRTMLAFLLIGGAYGAALLLAARHIGRNT